LRWRGLPDGEAWERRLKMIKADHYTVNILQSSGIGKVVSGNLRLSLRDRILALAKYFDLVHGGNAVPRRLRPLIADALIDYAKQAGMGERELIELLLGHCDVLGLAEEIVESMRDPLPDVIANHIEELKIPPAWVRSKRGASPSRVARASARAAAKAAPSSGEP